jgi:multiple antibiotic resistance protein
MLTWIETVFTSAIALFVIVEPFAALPMFAALSGRRPARELPRIARRASLAGAIILAVFAIAGRQLLAALGLSLDAVRAAGGLVLLFTALDMLRGRLSSCRCTPGEVTAASEGGGDIALVPLAIPLLAGPGAIATVVTLVSTHGGAGQLAAVLAAIALVFAATYVVLGSAALAQRLIGPAALTAAERVLGLLLAALSAQLLATGIRGLLG